MNKKYLVAGVLSLAVAQANAGEPNQAVKGDNKQVMLGLMAMSQKSVYVGGEDKSRILPFFSVEWGKFYFRGPTMGYKLYQNGQTTLSAGLELDGIFNDDRDDSPVLADMTKLDNVFSASLNYQYQTQAGQFGMSLKSDISNSHDGYSVDVSYSYPMRAGGWMIKPEVGIELVSEEVNQYWYGVGADDVLASRPLYTPESGVNYKLGVFAMYPLMQRHAIMVRANYRAYSSEVSDSPIVDEDNDMNVSVGWVYRF